MKTRRSLTVPVGIMVLSAGVVLMTGTSSAEKDLRGVTQNWDKNLPSDARFGHLGGAGQRAGRQADKSRMLG